MKASENIASPLLTKISFGKLKDSYELQQKDRNPHIASKARRIVTILNENPALINGISDFNSVASYRKEIDVVLQDAFSPILTKNEIKTASVPLSNFIFKSSERFDTIIENAGKNFELKIKNSKIDDDNYIISCTYILSFCYGFHINTRRPFYYEIPDSNGIPRFYKVLYNADFCEIIPTKKAKDITRDDYEELIDNFDNLDLWKEKFPPESYIFKGFVISNIFDVTEDQSISKLKSALIGETHANKKAIIEDFQDVFKSFFGIENLQVGFSIYNREEGVFERLYGKGISSYLLGEETSKTCNHALCDVSYDKLINEHKYLSVSDVEKVYQKTGGSVPHINMLYKQGFRSAIFSPVPNENVLMGVLEIVSTEPRALNSINAKKLDDVMPFIASSIKRSLQEEENLIEAIIQLECTSIHPSVHWRFVQEAKNYMKAERNQEGVSFKKIAFENVYPLYGQIDIKNSSEARNIATKKDLVLQLNSLKAIFKMALEIESLPIYEQFIFQIETFLKALNKSFQVNSEHKISEFFNHDINPVIKHLEGMAALQGAIKNYYNRIDPKLKAVYEHREDYDQTISRINLEMAALLDKKQIEAQNMYPHFFERYKTDGVEHNMYIGESITKEESFNTIYLYNLRLWQLQVMIEMEKAYYQMQSTFPVTLDVASLILVFNQPITISFRMDEKQFDVDGTYNARYEIVKKRIDKAYIKGTNKRITEKGKITIVYSQKEDEQEYLRYISFLQSKHLLDSDLEIVELQDLQAVTGLKALRVSVLYQKIENDKKYYTYSDLMKEL